jgi:hypothetical protein
MAFQISPGVSVSEVDLTTSTPAVQTTAGAYVGPFVWGPVNKRTSTTTEQILVASFGNPDSNTYQSFFSAASFLAYGNNLTVVRAANNATYNATANTNASPVQIQNKDIFETSYLFSNNNNQYGAFASRYPGALGNSLTVSVVDAASYSATWNINGIGVSSYFPVAPSTSAQAVAAGAANDQIHIVVMDTGGLFTGTKNTVLETFPFLSKGFDAKDSLGNPNYYKTAIFNNSKYIYAVDPVSYSTTNATWGKPLANTNYATISTAQTSAMIGGTDATVTDADIQTAWGQFTNADAVDISLVITGAASIAVQQYVIDNIASARKDCIAFVSPPSANVVNQSGSEVTNITAWNTALNRSTSYAVADSGWKYMFDKYNNVYRYIPLNGDIAGLCAYTDSVRAPWYSPAGYNRGNLKNVVRLAWNPSQTQRDSLYALGINPVVTFQGAGTILYGDKTLQSLPSAFDRINVRRLFIVLEKTIALASKYSMFEFNDSFTQAQFVALVTPFLRDVKGRRGIYDFQVVCDSTNNTENVIDANQFVGDIYIKPARSINYIQLNFVAVRTGVSFNTIVGSI